MPLNFLFPLNIFLIKSLKSHRPMNWTKRAPHIELIKLIEKDIKIPYRVLSVADVNAYPSPADIIELGIKVIIINM